MAETGTDRTAALARRLTALRFDALAEDDRAQLSRLLLDWLGVARRGAEESWSRAVAASAREASPSGPARILGGGVAAPTLAALANATAAHGLELDDTHDESVSHPGAPVFAVALAVGEATGARGPEILAAAAAGYECVGRLGAAVGAGPLIERGWHPTALFCGFGAATAAATLRGADADTLAAAWGLALSAVGGSMQFSEDASGTAVKRLHAGFAAQTGALAADLALRGVRGPARAFDGRYGMLALYGVRPDPERLDDDAPPAIRAISFKPYPCCRLFHSTFDALAEATDGFALAPERIRGIRVGGPVILATQHMLRRPESPMAAQYSLPFALAAALVHGPESVEGYAAERLSDPRLLALADRVEAETCPECEAAFPRQFGSWVEIEADDGRRPRVVVMDSLGTPGRPMDDAALARKYDRLTAGLGVADAAAARARVARFAEGGTVAELLEGY